MSKGISVIVVACVACAGLSQVSVPVEQGAATMFDVNDVSFLWPVAKTKADVDALLSLDDKLDDGTTPLLAKSAFDGLIATVAKVSVKDGANLEHTIVFKPFQDQFSKQSTWRVVAFRVDPSAPGTAPKVTDVFGSAPQIRLIAQPVTVDENGKVKVHDFTAHLVYNYVKEFDPPAVAGGPPRAIPDKDKFMAIITDLKGLKTGLKDANVTTAGKLSVHPGLKANPNGFSKKVQSFLKKYVRQEQLAAMAFMGIESAEPWIFFALANGGDGKFALMPNPSVGGKTAQMLILKGGDAVMPAPTTKNVDGEKGVSTAGLFANNAKTTLENIVFEKVPSLKVKHIPDLIANPQRAHFFNTDCVSCHSESTRRITLGIGDIQSEFRFARPEGVSGVDENVLPQDAKPGPSWNVRNFGWFPGRGLGLNPVATVTTRTANEAADSAAFVNKNYLANQR